MSLLPNHYPQLVRQLSNRFALQLPLNVLFEHKSVDSLADHIEGLISPPIHNGSKGEGGSFGEGRGEGRGVSGLGSSEAGGGNDDDAFSMIECSPETSLAIAELITTGVHPSPEADLVRRRVVKL